MHGRYHNSQGSRHNPWVSVTQGWGKTHQSSYGAEKWHAKVIVQQRENGTVIPERKIKKDKGPMADHSRIGADVSPMFVGGGPNQGYRTINWLQR